MFFLTNRSRRRVLFCPRSAYSLPALLSSLGGASQLVHGILKSSRRFFLRSSRSPAAARWQRRTTIRSRDATVSPSALVPAAKRFFARCSRCRRFLPRRRWLSPPARAGRAGSRGRRFFHAWGARRGCAFLAAGRRFH